MLCLFHKYNVKTLTKRDLRNHATKHFIYHAYKPGILHNAMLIESPLYDDYTSISRRINRLSIKVEDVTTDESKYNYVIIAIDRPIGIKITNRGQWPIGK